MKFLNSLTGFAIGTSGTLIKTSNGGETWVQGNSGVTFNLSSIYFSNTTSGWIVGNSGKILTTSDAGYTWVVNSDLGTYCVFHSVYFCNSTTGYAIGVLSDSYGNHRSFAYQTTNGGAWWYYEMIGTSCSLNSIFFVSPTAGWAVGDSGRVVGTIDGTNWIGQFTYVTNNLYSCVFPGTRTGWAAGANGIILKTMNSGYYDTLNTNRRDLGVIPMITNSSQLLNAKYRVMFRAPDTSYNVMRSLNGGVSFDTIFSHLPLSDTGKAFDGLLVRVQKIRMSGSTSTGYTGNCGVVQDPSLPIDLNQTKYMGWDYNPPQNRYLEGSKYLYTTAKPWQSYSMSLSYPHKNTYSGFASASVAEDLRKVEIRFTDTTNGQYSYRYKAGGTEYPYLFYTYQDMRKVPFTVWEVDATDSSSSQRQVNCMFLEFPDSAGGHPDGHWAPTADSLGGLEILYILNSNYSSVPDPNLTGKNLLLQQSQFPILYVWSPKLISSGLNYHVGDVFTIYPYTVTRPDIAPGHPLYYEFSTHSIIGIKIISGEVPTKISLSQNYPNPFNPTTKIKFSIPSYNGGKGDVLLKIYDILGREVTTLVNEQLKPGEYEVEWNGTNFASGVYFYQLRVGNYVQTRKMVLLK